MQLSISLDLNVFGFIHDHDDKFTPNLIDEESRYAFGKQKPIGKWNVERLADALSGSTPEVESPWDGRWLGRGEAAAIVRDSQAGFDAVYDECLEARRRLRLGLPTAKKDGTASTIGQEFASLATALPFDYHRLSRQVSTLFDDPATDEKQQAEAATTLLMLQLQTSKPALHDQAQHFISHLLREISAAGISTLVEPAAPPASPSSSEYERRVKSAVPAVVMRTAPVRRMVISAEASGSFEQVKQAAAALGSPFEDASADFDQNTQSQLRRLRADAEVSAQEKRDVRVAQTSCGGQ